MLKPESISCLPVVTFKKQKNYKLYSHDAFDFQRVTTVDRVNIACRKVIKSAMQKSENTEVLKLKTAQILLLFRFVLYILNGGVF